MTRDGMPYRPCVGVVLADAEGRIFVGERLDKSGAWQMPQGGIDKGETPRDAALRELWEETGVSAEMVTVEAETSDWVTYELPEELIGKLWGGKYRGQKQKWVLLRFHGTDDDIRIETEHPEFGQWKWSDKRRVLDEIVPFKRHVYAEVMKAFEGRI